MTAPGLGIKSHLGVGEESTWGSVVTRDGFIEFNSESLAKNIGRIESRPINRRGVLSTRVVQGGISVDGDIVFDATFGGAWLKLLKHNMGLVTTSQPDITNAPTAYNHAFTIDDSPYTGLSIEVYRDSSDFATEPSYAHLYVGCKVNSMEFSCDVDGLLSVTAGIIGKDESRGAKSTPTYTTSKVAAYHQGSIKWNGGDVGVNKFSLRIGNGLEPRPTIGSRYTREPFFGDLIDVSGSMEMEFTSWAQYDDFVAATQRTFEAYFEGDNLGGGIYYMIKMACAISLLNNVRVVADSPGRIMIACDFKAYRTSSANELQVDVRNIDSSI